MLVLKCKTPSGALTENVFLPSAYCFSNDPHKLQDDLLRLDKVPSTIKRLMVWFENKMCPLKFCCYRLLNYLWLASNFLGLVEADILRLTTKWQTFQRCSCRFLACDESDKSSSIIWHVSASVPFPFYATLNLFSTTFVTTFVYLHMVLNAGLMVW